jgi:hypothetical protein
LEDILKGALNDLISLGYFDKARMILEKVKDTFSEYDLYKQKISEGEARNVRQTV